MASQTAHPYRTLSFCWDPSWGAASPPSPDGGRGAARLCVLNLIWPPRGVSEKHLQLPHGQNSATPLPVPFPFLASPVCPDHQVLMSLCSPCSHPAQVTPPVPRGCPFSILCLSRTPPVLHGCRSPTRVPAGSVPPWSPSLPGAADPCRSSCPVTWSCCNAPSVWRPRPPPRRHLLPCPAGICIPASCPVPTLPPSVWHFLAVLQS